MERIELPEKAGFPCLIWITDSPVLDVTPFKMVYSLCHPVTI